MLKTLRIRDLAIVRELHLEFDPGLSVLTGETGAGKSIVVDALALLLGDKASADIVRAGAERARVEGVFAVDEVAELTELLEELGLESEDGELILAREIASSGRSRVYVNGALNTLSNLRRLGRTLVDLHGQHEHMRLLDPSRHLAILDAYAELEPLLERVAERYRRLGSLERERSELESDARTRAQRIDVLAYQLREIEQAELVAGEDEQLEAERRVLDNGERVLALAEGAYQQLYESEQAALDTLSEVERQLAELSGFAPQFEGSRERLQAARYELEDVALGLRDYARQLNFDPEQQARVNERLELLRRLKAKYGSSLAEVSEFASRVRSELERLMGSDERRASLEQELDEAREQYSQLAAQLSAERRKAAERLARAVERELGQLAMQRARFAVRQQLESEPTSPLRVEGSGVKPAAHGVDRVEFLFSANPGEPPRGLARVASGGELSRVQLALLSVLGGHGAPTATAVYDEVDTGISGRVGDAVGQRLHSLSRGRQVLCVTHLAQIAAHADHHMSVGKQLSGERVSVAVQRLDDSSRVEELARMIGGASVTASARRHARELLAQRRSRV